MQVSGSVFVVAKHVITQGQSHSKGPEEVALDNNCTAFEKSPSLTYFVT